MDEKEKKEESDTSKAPASGDEKKPESTKEDQKSDSKKDDGVDYKAELERSKTELEQAKHTIVTLKKKKGDKKQDEGEEDENEDDDTDIQEKIDKAVEERLNGVRNDLVSDTIDSVLDSLTSDPDERELIKHHYQNTIVKTGLTRSQIVSDMRNAQILANKPRFDKIISEMNRSNETKSSTSTPPVSGQNTEDKEITLSDAEEREAQRLATRYNRPIDDVRKRIVANRQS